MIEDERLVDAMGKDPELRKLSLSFLRDTARFKYTYHFTWLGRPIIQFPQDIVAVQEVVWSVRPQVIVETGIAHGGSLVLSASLLELIGGDGEVIGIDVDIREHNRKAITEHPLSRRIQMIQGSSTDPDVVRQVRERVGNRRPVLVILDSDHSHDHVTRELELYSPLVGRGSYLIVCDTAIEDMPLDSFPGRPWGKGNSPRTAVTEFLQKNHRFAVDRLIESKLLISASPDGYLKCVED